MRHGWPVSTDVTIRAFTRVQHGVVARRQLRAAGISDEAISRRVARGVLEPVTPRVLRLVGTPDVDAHRLMAAVLHVGGDAVLSHVTAAAWWGISGFRLGTVHVSVERNRHWEEDAQAVVHHATVIPPGERKVLRNIPISSPALVIFQLAATISPERVAAALDSAWSLRLLDGARMSTLLERLARPGRNGITLVRHLLEERGEDWVPPASNVEHRFERIMIRAGITTLRRQVNLGGEAFVGRVDFLDAEVPLVVEIQSERYHAALTDRAHDAARRAALEAAGFVVVEIWDFEIFHQPWVVVKRVEEARRRLLQAA